MMRRIVWASLRFRLLVVAVAAAVMVFGFLQLDDAPVDVLPEFTPPTVEIQTEALGLSAVEVEQLITAPFEQDLLSQVPFVDVIRSESIPGLSSIELIFEPGTDLLTARQLVQERLSEALIALPGVSRPPQMLQPVSSISRVMMVKLSSEELSLIDMSLLARWTIRPRLMGVQGVANVAVWGHREQQLQVLVDPERLRSEDVSLQPVIETTGNALWVSPLSFLEASTPGTGGFLDTPNQRLGVQNIQPINSPETLAEVVLEGTEGTTLGEVADVVEDHQLLIGDAVFTDGPGLLLVIEKLPGANTLEVTDHVQEALDALRPGLGDMKIDPSIYRPATYIETAIDNIALSVLIGAGLAVLALGAFLFSGRTLAISLLAILASLMAAGVVLYLRGTPFNAMVVAGLVMALGAVVDDAVVDVENVARRLRERHREGKGESATSIVLEGALEMRRAIILAVLIMLVAALPVFFMDPLVGGAFGRQVALSYALAVGASMAVALTVTPALSLLLLRNAPLERREPPLARGLHRGYDRVSARALGSPRRAYAAGGILVLAGVAVLPFMGRSVLPTFKDTELLIEMEAAPGTSLPEMSRVVGQAAAELRSLPGVRNVGAHVGRAVTSDEVGEVNSSQLWVSLDASADHDELVASIEDVVGGYPGLDVDLLTYPGKRVNEVLAGGEEPVAVRIYGVNPAVLRAKADEVSRVLSEIDGVAGARVEPEVAEPTVEVEVDIDAARAHGVKPGEVRRAAATLLSSIVVGNLFEEQKVFEVVVWGAPQVRQSLTTIRDLMIDTPGGGLVRLGDVADVRINPNPVAIGHDASSRFIDVTADVEGRDLGAVLADAEDRLGQFEFPLEHHAELLGDYAEQQAAQTRLLVFAVTAAIGIFLLLQAAFGSWRLASVVFLSLPVALSGGLLAALAGGGTLTLGSLVGLFLVFGVAVRHAVVLVRSYQRLERAGEPSGQDLVRRATTDRVVPVLMTIATTGLAVLPFLVFGDVPGQEILHPMAVVVLGGLVTSTLLTLFVIPPLYVRFGSMPAAEDLSLELEQELLSGVAPAMAGSGESPRHDSGDGSGGRNPSA